MRVSQIVIATICGMILQASLVADDTVTLNLDDAEFRRLHTLLQPSKDELWRTIPWKISVLDAQRTAVAEKKPIFIWAMDGHPLGCT